MMEMFKAECRRTRQLEKFVLDKHMNAYLCTCDRCTKNYFCCRSMVTLEQLKANPDGDVFVHHCRHEVDTEEARFKQGLVHRHRDNKLDCVIVGHDEGKST